MTSIDNNKVCQLCGSKDKLSWCSRCQLVMYCSREHQRQHWKLHKKSCQPIVEGVKKLNMDKANKKADSSANSSTTMSNGAYSSKPAQTLQWAATNSVQLEKFTAEEVTDSDKHQVRTIWKSMQDFGICILDKFLPEEQAEEVCRDVVQLYRYSGTFVDGEIVKQGSNLGPYRVRGDRIRWIDESYASCKSLRHLCKKLDKYIQLCSHIGSCNIISRTKPMVACYPGNGACYKKHVDNPVEDGRCLTCLYYINKDWNPEVDGGSLCLYPKGRKIKMECQPLYNRLCIFFSNDRNPHEVLPTFKERFAITCWYFDQDERQKALTQWAQTQKHSDVDT